MCASAPPAAKASGGGARGGESVVRGEPEVSHSVLFPTFLQPLSNALRVFKRDKPRERWRPVGRPPLALSSQLEANGLAFGGAVFDKPLATVVEQRPLANVLRRPANRFSAGAGAVPSWAGPLRAPSSQAGERKAAALPALNELEDAWLACRQGGCTGPPWSFPRG